MARIRTIKPEFWSSEQIMDCSTNARLLFIGLWNFCDDGGNHPASARTIKAEIFPGDDIASADIQRMLDELSSNHLIVRYIAENKEFYHVTGWKHQKIDKPSYKYPPYSDDENKTIRRILDEDSPPEGKGKVVESNVKESSVVVVGEYALKASTSITAETISTILSKYNITFKPTDQRIKDLTKQPLSIEIIKKACQQARKHNPNGKLTIGYIISKLDDWHKKSKLQHLSRTSIPIDHEYKEWCSTNTGIEQKGKELGINARVGESYQEFKCRILNQVRRMETYKA